MIFGLSLTNIGAIASIVGAGASIVAAVVGIVALVGNWSDTRKGRRPKFKAIATSGAAHHWNCRLFPISIPPHPNWTVYRVQPLSWGVSMATGGAVGREDFRLRTVTRTPAGDPVVNVSDLDVDSINGRRLPSKVWLRLYMERADGERSKVKVFIRRPPEL